VEVEIDLTKNLEENASDYFEKGKKAKLKVKRIEKAILQMEKRIKSAGKKVEEEKEKKSMPIKKRKKEWFEKFHWFYSSDSFLVLGGRDRHSNEVLIKKYMQEDDVYFHTEIHGASHCIIKSEKKKVSEKTKKEAAVFAAVFSEAWTSKIASIICFGRNKGYAVGCKSMGNSNRDFRSACILS